MSELETERDRLREQVRCGDTTIGELAATVARLRASARSLTDDASRLRADNDRMAGRVDGLLEQVGRLEEAEREQSAAAGEQRQRAETHRAGEADLRRQLDNALDEQVRAGPGTGSSGHRVSGGSFGSSFTSGSPGYRVIILTRGVRPEFFRFSKKCPKC